MFWRGKKKEVGARRISVAVSKKAKLSGSGWRARRSREGVRGGVDVGSGSFLPSLSLLNSRSFFSRSVFVF